jgi:uncharacterized membrane protein (DUF485 family)
MRVVYDEKNYRRKERLARIVTTSFLVIAIGVLVLMLFAPNFGWLNPQNFNAQFLISIGILAVIFIFSRVVAYLGNRYLSPLRPAKVIEENLKGMDRKHTLMVYNTPSDYVLIEPGGLSVLIPRTQQGLTSYKNGKWKHGVSIIGAWMGRDEPLGDPSAQASNELNKINALIQQKLPGLKVPLRAIIVFTHPRSRLDAEPSPTAVIRAEDLKDFLRGAGKLPELPKSIQRKMREALGAPEINETDK